LLQRRDRRLRYVIADRVFPGSNVSRGSANRRDVREHIGGLPDGFSFHDLRHYLASLLIASGADIKTVQARMRHATARTTLDTYGHMWPDADESTRIMSGMQ
jgi:integrase